MITRTGWGLVAAGVALLVAATLVDYVELAALGLACLGAVGIGLAWVARRPSFEVEREVAPVRVTVGDPAGALMRVRNTAGRASLPMLARDRLAGGGPGMQRAIEIGVPRLAAGASHEVTYPVPTTHRAIVDVGPLELTRSDPLGAVRAVRVHGTRATVYVHPRHHRLTPLPPALERSLEGPTTDSAPRGTQAFHTLREYTPGDDRRMIHWRTSARTGTLMVRQHVDTSLPDLTVVLDTRRQRHTPRSFEAAVEAAASLILACTAGSFPVRARTTDGQVWDPVSGQAPSVFFLDRLAGVQPHDDADLLALSQQLGSGRSGFALVVLSASLNGEDMRSLAALRGRFGSVTAVDFRDGSSPPVVPGVGVLRAGSGEEFAAVWNHGVLV